ncbi:RagB/SusD family nutrient uptake outer membrane protein [Sphingobacterium wenxiniae]|uniref:Starch-binding associating with outer membrane n=1 Tax=Sphingobacterium wenxiniae TaxID=683125 RepID=A0A1I6NVJ4_9SPHI|nr:RagB/SusD family nutrient uptake outer membrane protein [Sphingobacterium wenxiniae]SFS31859.1 Starch-binding associating with outer membrane [Sphingobacterium wenxiniae]
MKRLLYIITIAIFTVLIQNSCSKDFLEVESADKLYVDEYYNSESRIFEALVAAYDPLQWFDYAWGQYTHIGLVSDVMADDVYVGGADANDCIYLHRMFNYEALPTSVVSDLWTTFYSGVNRSNIVMQYMDNVQGISDDTKALYLAEAKVLRSFYYTWLWKLWGNIPYYETNLTYPYIADQNTADEVYQGIITTLEDAINNGGLPMKAGSGREGRVSLAMAYMLYAEVVMYQNDDSRLNQALKYMEEIIKSGQYDLVSNFAGLWEESGEWSQESIFEINYFSRNAVRSWSSPTTDGGSVYPKFIGIYNLAGSPDYDGGWGFEPVRADAYALYDDNDQRRDGGILNFAKYAEQTGATYQARYQDQGYFLKKYMARKDGNANHSADADLNYNNNFRVYRYAETLLNAAELIARGASGTGTAQSYLDKVRTRAGLNAISPSVENIIKERRLEFLGEGKRYWDLIRSGYAPTYLIPDGLYRTSTWTTSKKYLPIPQSEIDASAGTLTQNNY